MEPTKGKKYFYIDNNVGNEVFALLEEVGSEDEADISDVMNDSDTEFVAEEELEQPHNNFVPESTLVPEANVCVVSDIVPAKSP